MPLRDGDFGRYLYGGVVFHGGDVLHSADVLFDAVDVAFVVVVDDGFCSHQSVGEGSAKALQGVYNDSRCVEVVEHLLADLLRGVLCGSGVPLGNDVEADGEVGVLNLLSECSPLDGFKFDKERRCFKRGFLFNELDVLVPEVEVFEKDLPTPLSPPEGGKVALAGDFDFLEALLKG